jgi:hypothetical protein
METLVKAIDVKKIKSDIKELAAKQIYYKNQRKTEKIVGEREMKASDATYKHQSNRETLRIMYAAYGLGRGKSFSQIENHYSEEEHPLKKLQYSIDKMINKYELKGVE